MGEHLHPSVDTNNLNPHEARLGSTFVHWNILFVKGDDAGLLLRTRRIATSSVAYWLVWVFVDS